MPDDPPPSHAAPASTRERLLDAAREVFARDGLRSATTREIAQVAGVNEVTLFRLFQSKQNLLAAVLERESAEGPEPSLEKPAEAGQELKGIVQEYVAKYSARVRKNVPLLRVLFGEIQHFQEHELMVIHGIFLPHRQKIIDRLCRAQKEGLVRADANPVIVADQLRALVFMGVMKTALPLPRKYTLESYLEASIATILRAIEA